MKRGTIEGTVKMYDVGMDCQSAIAPINGLHNENPNNVPTYPIHSFVGARSTAVIRECFRIGHQACWGSSRNARLVKSVARMSNCQRIPDSEFIGQLFDRRWFLSRMPYVVSFPQKTLGTQRVLIRKG